MLRKLVNESNGIFLSIKKINSVASGDLRPELVKHSKQYRSILRACVESLQDATEKCRPEEKSVLENFLTIFYNVECVWHLTEILYIDVIPGTFLNFDKKDANLIFFFVSLCFAYVFRKYPLEFYIFQTTLSRRMYVDEFLASW